MAYPSPSHGFTLMVHRLPARRIHAAALSDFRHIPITRNNISPNSDEPPGRPLRFSSAFYDGDVMVFDGLPTEETAAPRTPARSISSAFYDGDVMIFDGLRTEETAAPPPTPVHGLSKEAISRFMKTEAAAPDPEELCAVCQENYRDNQRVGVLRCRHRFHADCIGKWLQIKNVCPLCNAVGLSSSCKN